MASLTIIPTRSNDVSVYPRHVSGCKNTSAKNLKRCVCPKWIYIKATQKRQSARTTSWATAEDVAQKLRDSLDPVKRELAELKSTAARKQVLLDHALKTWLNHKRGDNVKESSVRTYRSTVGKFVAFANKKGVTSLHEVSSPLLTDWKNDLPDGEHLSTKRKRRGHLRDFFRFCVENQIGRAHV